MKSVNLKKEDIVNQIGLFHLLASMGHKQGQIFYNCRTSFLLLKKLKRTENRVKSNTYILSKKEIDL